MKLVLTARITHPCPLLSLLFAANRVEKNHDFYFFKSDFFYLNRI